MAANLRPRILLLIPHLGGGGAERVMALLAQGLGGDDYDLHLALVTPFRPDAGELPPSVTIHELGASRVRAGAFRLLRLVRSLKPDAILAGMYHLNFLVLLLRPLFPRKTRVLVRQNGTVSAALRSDGLSWHTRLLYRLLYPRADRIVCQTAAMAGDLARELGIEERSLAVLPNPVPLEAIRAAASLQQQPWTGPGPHLLAVGRLSAEKGFDLLLSALAEVRRQIPGADLCIAGAGAEEAALRAQCAELGLDAAVRFAGRVPCPWQYFSGAALFVLPSRHEGLPNALLEAAAGGLPLAALPASEGLVDLLRGLPGVWLAPEISAPALAAALLAALQSLHPGQRFAHRFVEEFSMDRSILAYRRLIAAVLEGKRR